MYLSGPVCGGRGAERNGLCLCYVPREGVSQLNVFAEWTLKLDQLERLNAS